MADAAHFSSRKALICLLLIINTATESKAQHTIRVPADQSTIQAGINAAANGDTVLVGHSYAGSVITGVADRFPGRIGALVYLDAFLPEAGDSCWSLTNDEQRNWYVAGCARTGYGVDPLPFFDERARPHPVATFLQALPLTGAWRDVPTKHYVAASWPDESPMARSTRRAAADPSMVVHHWNTRHNVMADGPDLVLGLLRGLPGYTTG